MTKSAFDKIAAGLEDAIAHAGGDTSRGRAHEPVDVKAIRAKTGKSQKAFADAFMIPVGTLRDWEQGRRIPDAPARTLLTVIGKAPHDIERLIGAS